ncbi:MAG: DUF512 domain-containing protein, partial [Bacillota bacterium]
GIKIHTQVVLCPGYNDGCELDKTIADLFNMGPGILSLAVVPLGLTAHRDGLIQLRKHTEQEADQLLNKVEKLQEVFLKQRGTRFIFASDEFYHLALRPVPPDECYEGYPQLENGVGLARQFLNELHSLKDQATAYVEKQLHITIAAAPAAAFLLKELAEILRTDLGLDTDLQIIKNKYFGEEVTVSGLLTGSDLIRSLKGKALGDVVFITKSMLKDSEDIFLDDISLKEVEKELRVHIIAVDGPLEMLSELLKGGLKIDR